MANENIKLDEGIGSVRIADEVVSIIAGMAATEVDGIAGMSGGLVGGIAEILGKKNLAKGVKEAVAADGIIGAFTGGVVHAAGGITAAIVFGLLAALLFHPKDKS